MVGEIGVRDPSAYDGEKKGCRRQCNEGGRIMKWRQRKGIKKKGYWKNIECQIEINSIGR